MKEGWGLCLSGSSDKGQGHLQKDWRSGLKCGDRVIKRVKSVKYMKIKKHSCLTDVPLNNNEIDSLGTSEYAQALYNFRECQFRMMRLIFCIA